MSAIADRNRADAAKSGADKRYTPEPGKSDARDLQAWMLAFNRSRFGGPERGDKKEKSR